MLFIFYLISYAFAHSWVHCVDYDSTASLLAGTIQNTKCRSFPRGVPNTAIFGEDRGYNYQPIRDKACRSSFSGSFSSFSKGRTIRLLWPAKNHVAASCTNPYIKDQSLKLYLFPVNKLDQPDPTFSTWRTPKYLFFDFEKDGQGFQNCPDACPVIDRLPCYGDIYFPSSLATGYYKALWVWNFNPNEWFTSCFDIEIKDPSARTPTARTPTSQPSLKSPTTQCAGLHQQCGGIGWTGTTCCISGKCTVMNSYYSQCLP